MVQNDNDALYLFCAFPAGENIAKQQECALCFGLFSAFPLDQSQVFLRNVSLAYLPWKLRLLSVWIQLLPLLLKTADLFHHHPHQLIKIKKRKAMLIICSGWKKMKTKNWPECYSLYPLNLVCLVYGGAFRMPVSCAFFLHTAGDKCPISMHFKSVSALLPPVCFFFLPQSVFSPPQSLCPPPPPPSLFLLSTLQSFFFLSLSCSCKTASNGLSPCNCVLQVDYLPVIVFWRSFRC